MPEMAGLRRRPRRRMILRLDPIEANSCPAPWQHKTCRSSTSSKARVAGPAKVSWSPCTTPESSWTGRRSTARLIGTNPFLLCWAGGQVIAGWDLGVATLREGDKVKLTLPPHLAYGAEGYPGAIPPNATLIFDIELLRVE